MSARGGAGRSGDAGLRTRGESLLVGRAREQLLLREELQAAISGHGRLVLIGGEAGIGKTSLARELAQEAGTLGVRVLRGHCYDLANTPPYGPWIDLVAAIRATPDLPVPPEALNASTRVQVTDQTALFGEVRRFFAELARLGPILLILEDLHWADPASGDLLRSLSVALGQWSLLLVATYRIDESSRHQPFYLQLPALVRETQVLRLNLGAFDREALRELVAGRYRLPDADEGRLVAYLERHSEGNPFFAVELIRALEEGGLLRRGDERSSLGELARVVVPPLLRQVIDGRVARLGEEIRQRLEIAAVIGQEVPLDLWATLADLDDETLIESVERALWADLLEADRDGTRVRFAHALTREALYEGILPLRRRLWHRRVAETLAIDPSVDPDVVALHFQQAGDPRAVEWLIKAGDRAQRVYAWVMAAERLRSAASLLEGVDGHEATYRELVFRASYLSRFADPGSSLRALDEVNRLARNAGDVHLQAEVQYNSGIQYCYSDRFRDGLNAFQHGLQAMESNVPSARRIYDEMQFWFANLAASTAADRLTDDERVVERLQAMGIDPRRCSYPWFLASAGPSDVAAELADQFIGTIADVANPSGWVSAILAYATHGRAISSAALGRPGEARQAWARSRELFGVVEHFALMAFTLLGELRDVALTYGAADPADRRRLAAEAEVMLARTGGALRPGVSPRLAWLGCFVLDGRWEEADQILGDLPPPRNSYLRREVTAATATLARHRGQSARAWAAIESLLPDGAATDPGNIIHQEGLFLQRLAADLCLDAGDPSGARSWLEAHDRWLTWGGSVLGRADGLIGWARWFAVTGDAARARSCAQQALDLAASPDQPLVRGAALLLLGEVALSEARYAEAESSLTSALHLADICEAPFERAFALLAMTELRLATGEPDSAVTLLSDIRATALSLGASNLLARADELLSRTAVRPDRTSFPAGLTPREVDVLRLLAQHQTDKEIAEALSVSPRTVQSHVASILGKLGVENRRLAAAEAVRLELV